MAHGYLHTKFYMDGMTCKKIERFSQAMYQCTFHSLSAIFACRILRSKHWLWPADGWPPATSFSFIEADFKFYYLMFAARYVSGKVSSTYEHQKLVRYLVCWSLITVNLTTAFLIVILRSYHAPNY
jgi:hypothetical protein